MMESDSGGILVVDDSLPNIELLQAHLTRAGYQVRTATSGQECLDAVAAKPPDLILLDVMMPGMDGFEVCRRLRSHDSGKSIPVVMVTALQERADKLRALEMGANDFLSKPVDRAELLARVRTLLELHKMLRAQDDLIRMKDELLSVVSHELRTPLASLVGFAELLLTRTYSDEQQREFLTVMHQEGRRLTALIGDFLDLQRMESGRQSVHLQPCSLREAIDRAVATVGEDPQRPITVDVPDDLPEVDADPDRLVQVLCNLLSNARKYSPQGGQIAVNTLLGERGIRVRVRDHGLGLPPEALPKLFQKFYRVDNSDRRAITGTGLGLAICRQIIAEHGGRIGVNSAGLGEGSVFWFTLPIAKPNPVRGDVLIVEDDVGFARLLEAELAALGLSAIRAPNAAAALDSFASACPKGIALDLLLPDMPGEAVLESMSRSGRRLPPVVVITVKDRFEAEPRLKKLGARAVLQKGPEVASTAASLLAELIAADALVDVTSEVPA
ncbi:MAG TPA: response regulator [Chloroflexota bacterium]|nr:response regulator [Chloroflexota bacterium]